MENGGGGEECDEIQLYLNIWLEGGAKVEVSLQNSNLKGGWRETSGKSGNEKVR